eukprot:UN30974
MIKQMQEQFADVESSKKGSYSFEVGEYWPVILGQQNETLRMVSNAAEVELLCDPNVLHIQGQPQNIEKAVSLLKNIIKHTKIIHCDNFFGLFVGTGRSYLNEIETAYTIETFTDRGKNLIYLYGEENNVEKAYNAFRERSQAVRLIDVGVKWKAFLGKFGDNAQYINENGVTMSVSEGVIRLCGTKKQIDEAAERVENLLENVESHEFGVDAFILSGPFGENVQAIDK